MSPACDLPGGGEPYRGGHSEASAEAPRPRWPLVAKRLKPSRAAGGRTRQLQGVGVLDPAGRRHAVPASAARGLFQSGSHGRAGPGDGLHDPGPAGAGQVGHTSPPCVWGGKRGRPQYQCMAWGGGKVRSFPPTVRGPLRLGLCPPLIGGPLWAAFSLHLPGLHPPSWVVLVEPDGRGVLSCITLHILGTCVVVLGK